MTSRSHVVALALAAVTTLAIPGRAEQLIIADVNYTHSAETTTDSHYYADPLPVTPADWTSPIDWTKGAVHVRLVVKTKPTNTPTRFQVCFDVKPEYGCTLQSEAYREPGVYDTLTPFPSIWYPTTTFDWSQGVRSLALILKDADTNSKPQGDPLYVPTDLRVEVSLLSEGAVYVPPAPPPDAGAGTGPDAGASADAGGPTPPTDSGVDSSSEPSPAGGAGGAPPAASGGSPPAASGGSPPAASGGSSPIGTGGAPSHGLPDAGTQGSGGRASAVPTQTSVGGGGCAVPSPARAPHFATFLLIAGASIAARIRRRGSPRSSLAKNRAR